MNPSQSTRPRSRCFALLAPRWEVDTARAQTNRGDPDAGLSVEERAAKHGLVCLTRALAVEFTKEQLRVNVVCPGGMLTPQVTEFQAPENADYNLIMRIAAPRGMMAPVDVAKVIAFLASDDAATVHGAVYNVDNGKTAG